MNCFKKTEGLKYVHNEEAHNMVSPGIVVPVVLKFVQPENVVDFGCGIGTWLHAFKNNGVNEVLGLDGKWYNPKLLFKHISPDEFKCVDLEYPIRLEKKYDLVVSLEVAEHLSAESADIFVESLTNAGKVILFSAAFPGQGGENHLNEQWYDYWVKKFEKHNYYFHDVIRNEIWNNRDVQRWYKQNMFFVVHKDVDFNYPEDSTYLKYGFLHPDFYYMLSEYTDLVQDGQGGGFFYFNMLMKSIKNKFFKLIGCKKN